MRRLIWGFAGRKYHIVGNLMHWLNSVKSTPNACPNRARINRNTRLFLTIRGISLTIYPYSTQATNRPNWFFVRGVGGGDGDTWGFINFFCQSWCSTSQSRVRYDDVRNIRGNRLNSAGIAQEFITISKITLGHAARRLRNQWRIS